MPHFWQLCVETKGGQQTGKQAVELVAEATPVPVDDLLEQCVLFERDRFAQVDARRDRDISR